MEKLIKLNNEFYLVKSDYHDGIKQSILIVSGREVLACTQKFEKLPLLNRTQIESMLPREINIEELSKEEIQTTSSTTLLVQRMRFIHGYEKALQDTKNKFTLEDLKSAYIQGGFDSNAMARTLHKEIKSYKSAEDYIYSILEKKNEWDVEVETTEDLKKCSCHKSNVEDKHSCEHYNYDNKCTKSLQLKIISGFVNILSIK